jgi:hypothetical protein
MRNILTKRYAGTIAAAIICGIALVALRGASPWIWAADDLASPTPAATLAAFAKTLDDGNAATLSTLVIGDAKEREWVIAFSAHLRAFGDLEQALVKRFGKNYAEEESGTAIREQFESARDEDLPNDLKRAKLGKPDGDTVLVIFDEAASDDRQGRLVRVDGQWKMDIGSLSNYFSVDDTPGVRAIADAAAGLAKDVTAGKFASLEETATAVEERLTAAESVGAKKPQPAPAAKPKRIPK